MSIGYLPKKVRLSRRRRRLKKRGTFNYLDRSCSTCAKHFCVHRVRLGYQRDCNRWVS